ncbi:MAG: hypothetical protein KAJ51_13905, partial [Thermoplasmata archaeon]|nr:hypothetical protein [Thermoplasmata archaeon]
MRLKRIFVLFVVLSILFGNLFVFQITAVDNSYETEDQLEWKEIERSKTIPNHKNDKIISDKNNLNPDFVSPGNSIRDQNNNKISDNLDAWIANGYPELSFIIMYDRKITDEDIQKLNDLDLQIDNIFWHLDMISLRAVPVTLLSTISNLPGVQRLENHGIPVLYSDIATPAVKARESDLYSPFTA